MPVEQMRERLVPLYNRQVADASRGMPGVYETPEPNITQPPRGRANTDLLWALLFKSRISTCMSTISRHY